MELVLKDLIQYFSNPPAGYPYYGGYGGYYGHHHHGHYGHYF